MQTKGKYFQVGTLCSTPEYFQTVVLLDYYKNKTRGSSLVKRSLKQNSLPQIAQLGELS